MLYPIKFKPIYKEKIWGGNVLSTTFNKDFDDNLKIGESWELSAVPNEESIVINGALKGTNLKDLISKYGANLLGERVFNTYSNEFPLLIKFIDASDKLSVQVHPNDDYAKKHYNSFGKTEIWIVLSARKGAKLIAGLKDTTNEKTMRTNVENHNISESLNYIDVEKGDVIFIPAGRVHAILDGITLAEVQQTSDITFRLHDWDRVDDNGNPRELHIEKSFDVINFDDVGKDKLDKVYTTKDGISKANIINHKYFSIDEIKLDGASNIKLALDSTFNILMGVEGNGKIVYNNGELDFAKGDTILIPAEIKEYNISGNIDFLKVYL